MASSRLPPLHTLWLPGYSSRALEPQEIEDRAYFDTTHRQPQQHLLRPAYDSNENSNWQDSRNGWNQHRPSLPVLARQSAMTWDLPQQGYFAQSTRLRQQGQQHPQRRGDSGWGQLPQAQIQIQTVSQEQQQRDDDRASDVIMDTADEGGASYAPCKDGCTFVDGSDTCRRCLRARKEAGAKERGVTPKRRLHRIGKNASRIKGLMHELENSNDENARTSVTPFPESVSELSSISDGGDFDASIPHRHIQAWINQARHGVQLFNNLGAGSASFDNDDLESSAGDYSSEGSDEGTEMGYGEMDTEEGVGQGKIQRCARCMELMVSCIFDGVSDTCKRCTETREECIIPFKKKWPTPPKREHLLNQIKDQSEKIDELMRKLEHANSRVAAAALAASSPTTSRSAASADDALPPSSSLSMKAAESPASSNELSSELSSLSGVPRAEEAAPHPDVQAWIDQARDSMQVFNGIIGGGARFVGDDPGDLASEESDSDDEALSSYSYEGGSDVVARTQPGSDQVHIDILNSDGVRGRSREGSLSGLKKLRTKTSAGQLGAGAPSSSSAMGTIKDMLRHLRLSSAGAAGPDEPCVLNSNFFKPGTSGEENAKQLQHVPHILARGLMSPKECEELFKIYFDYMNLSLSLLDPHIYTAQNTCGRSPFLFTVVCAIASRYYTKRPKLYPALIEYVHGAAIVQEPKTVDLVHAYILLAFYPVPSRRWEDDRSWVYLGLAICIAMDINLHCLPNVKPINEQHERELLNRTRAWLNCFNLDRSMGLQHGKAPIIPNSDYVAVRSASWWQSSRFNMPSFDIHTCAYNAELRVMADFYARTHNNPTHPTGLNLKLDLEKMSTEVDEELLSLENQWRTQLVQSDMNDVQNHFRFCLIQLAYSYARLSALSFGFSHAFGKGNSFQKDQSLFMRCMCAASDVVLVTVEKAGAQNQRIFLRHGPEAQSVFVSFAAAFLIKLLHPKYAHYLTIDQRIEIRNLVQRVVDLLGSSDVAIDEHHGPKLYSRFLEGLLETPTAQINPGTTLAPPRSGKRRRSPASIDLILGHTLPIEHALPTAPSCQSMDSTAMLPNADQASATAAALVAQQQHQQPGFASTAATLLGDQASSLGLNTSRFFSPPLAFDPELLESMQSLPVWNEHMLPGWKWISALNSMQLELAGQVDMFPSMDMAQMDPQAAQSMLA